MMKYVVVKVDDASCREDGPGTVVGFAHDPHALIGITDMRIVLWSNRPDDSLRLGNRVVRATCVVRDQELPV